MVTLRTTGSNNSGSKLKDLKGKKEKTKDKYSRHLKLQDRRKITQLFALAFESWALENYTLNRI